MQQTVESHKTLLVDGPASVRVVSGKVEVFGNQLRQEAKAVVREGKRLPFFAVETAVLGISMGVNASLQEVSGNTIPQSWDKPIESLLSVQKRPTTVLILGKIDSGKSSFCTYLVNKIVNEKCKVGVLDGDVGQSDIGPSGTVSYGLISKPVTELYHLRLQNAFFVGVDSPLLATAKIIEGLTAMKAEILQRQVDFVVVNSDGWVVGDTALRFKTALVKELRPDLVVGVQVETELTPLIGLLGTPVITVEASAYLSPRTSEKRKNLREMTYARYLKGAKLHCYPMSQVTIEPRNWLPKEQEPERGLLVGFCNGTKFLGIGILRKINEDRKVLKVQTSIFRKPTKILIGKVLLDRKLRELKN